MFSKLKTVMRTGRSYGIILGASLLAFFFIFSAWFLTVNDYELFTITGRLWETGQGKRIKVSRVLAKGLYLTAYSAGTTKKIDEILALLDKTELNAVVIDIKDYSGKILYDSGLPLVNSLKTEDNQIGDVRALVKKLHRRGAYVIARQTVFQDPILAKKKPEWAIKDKYGGVWRDRKGLAWVDPTRREVWDYNLSIAKEASGLGFDEINFDYMRFPSDGDMARVVYTAGDKKKYEVMGEFYKFLSDALATEPVWISIDMFGFVMEKKGEDDMNIGQRLEDALDHFDYICPMMYPSHYPAGHLGLKNPAASPAMVIENGLKLGAPRFKDQRARLRPWLQAFNLGAVYGAENIRAEINTTEKYTEDGWLLWNAVNRYTSAGLR